MSWKVLWRTIHLIQRTLLKSPFITFFSSDSYVAQYIPAPLPHSLVPLSIPPQPSQSIPAHLPLFLSPCQFISISRYSWPLEVDESSALGIFHFSSLCITHSAKQQPGLCRCHNSKANFLSLKLRASAC